MAAFILVHSPLLGPTSWSWVADELRRRGNDVVVPSLVQAATSGGWKACVAAVAAVAPPGEPATIVGHSGAGPLLPAISGELSTSPARLVFVDTALPPPSGEVPLVPAQFLEALRDLAREGTLPPWSEWFESGSLDALIPDADRRDAVFSELPRLPLSFFEEAVFVPDGWTNTACAYVLLSDIYAPEAAEAAARGWPVLRLQGSHLDLVTRPAELAAALLQGARA